MTHFNAMRIKSLITEFIASEKAGGFILIGCTIFSLIITNSQIGKNYLNIWQCIIQGHSIAAWINDGLMAIFFLLIGLELKREIQDGALSNLKPALLPIISAMGGVIIPASIFLYFNTGTATQNGAGIPMATDIAFTLGMLALAGNSIPKNLKIFLTALAVIDDLCAIIVIAVFYTEEISLVYLVITASLFLLLLALNKLKVSFLWLYILIGVIMWFTLLHSGIHATLAGVLLAIALPSEKIHHTSISNKVQHYLHFPVAFVIIPLFALANTCIIFSGNWYNGLFSTISMGVIFGLFIGKPIGIFLFSWLAVSFGICELPANINWKHILGAGMLAGIGFTMSIFICLLAFNDVQQIDEAKIAIIFGSSLSAIFGIAYLRIVSRTKIRTN